MLQPISLSAGTLRLWKGTDIVQDFIKFFREHFMYKCVFCLNICIYNHSLRSRVIKRIPNI